MGTPDLVLTSADTHFAMVTHWPCPDRLGQVGIDASQIEESGLQGGVKGTSGVVCPRTKSQRGLSSALGRMAGQLVVVPLAAVIQDPLQLLYLVEVQIFPSHIAHRPVIALYLGLVLSLIHISEPTRPRLVSRMPSSA